MTKTLRERYFANEILQIGDIVEDSATGEEMKILDRGSNYITVATTAGITKKWLTEVVVEDISVPVITEKKSDFKLLESGQIELFGYETRNFELNLSEFILEQFNEFDDLYSKHQIIKLLDSAIAEQNLDRKFEILEKVSGFYNTQDISEPIIVEGMKNELERRRIADILAAVAGVEPVKSTYQTVMNSIKALKEKYQRRTQWEVLWPFFKLAERSGLVGITQNLPYNLNAKEKGKDIFPEESKLNEELIELLEDNFDELVESFDIDDITEAFDEELSDEFLSEEQLDEVLSMTGRAALGRKMHAKSTVLAARRQRALTRGATSQVLQSRARKLAETMLKRRLFRKAPKDMTRQEKERFESGASRRKALVAKLAMRLIGKVRMLQAARMHPTNNTAITGHTAQKSSGSD
jgi:hypothetical protein